ncbi:NAD(P)/FAD-dependent oxidoreductase [bacterium]|nr:NAD(P)/FAD-dependent oxidoreductase [bacterium]MBU1064172.1 NAD(P)/FAD-dependent oxidoreductase [bacterium]MBU1633386.1 NAD(P)/FAD-dependent oxidoreductase [bacterium]MBU1874819.1 NAD(P)/FAD-dependent oxidoreductase [bacterium]
MKKHYNIAIVGGGPAGTTAARFATSQGASVVVLERDREIGVPVRCAEGISKEGLTKYVDINPNWIAGTITDFGFISPSGKMVVFHSPTIGYILHRRLFDHALAEIAADMGAEIYTKAYVHGLRRDGSKTTLYLRHIGTETEVEADIVIAADGIESRIAHLAGFNTKLSPKDVEPCAQMQLANIDVNPNRGDFYLSNNWAPGGYVWAFPKGENTANVGLGISGKYAGNKSALEYLKDFVAEKFPKASILTTTAGGVPVAKALDKLVGDGLMVIGDAAHQVNPLTGGGISTAMAAGKMAGSVAASAVKDKDISAKRLSEYQKQWDKTIGKDIKRLYRLKEWAINLTDTDYEDIARSLDGLTPEQVTLVKIFKQAVKKKPSLVIDVLKVFAGF